MATRGLVGGVNRATTGVTTSSNTSGTTLQGSLITETSTPITASVGESQTYNARILNTDSASVEYIGVESDSMYVNVDNSNRTISGEVKWLSMIAANESQEDAYHAYPANKARLNFDNISATLSTIQDNVTVLEDSCKKSTTNINKYVDDLSKIQQALTECQQACVALRNELDAEITERERDHVKLRATDADNLNTLKTDINNLTMTTLGRLDNQDVLIKAAKDEIASEALRAKEEEGNIASSLQSTTRLLLDTKDNVSKLDEETHSLKSKLNQIENSDRFRVVEEHTAQLEDFGNRISTIDLRLTSRVDAATEETSRLHDVTYRNRSDISIINSELKETADIVDDIKQSQYELEQELSSLNASHTEALEVRDTQYMSLSSRIYSEAQVRRETDVFHEKELSRLETRISMLQTELVQVIQNLADELRLRDDELAADVHNLNYDFIDAGNAPI